MKSNESEGISEMEFTTINSTVESLGASAIFHVVSGVLGFALYMHHQIPSLLDKIFLEFEMLRMEYQELRLICGQSEVKASSRRMNAGKMREVKLGIRRLEKLTSNVSNVNTALQSLITEIPNIQRIMLVIGSSPVWPQHIYELHFSHDSILPGPFGGFTKSKIDEAISKKAIRALISMGAGSNSIEGPSKLFLLVQAPSSLSLPVHFLPKRNFKYNNKIVPFRLWFQPKKNHYDSALANSINLSDSNLVWFQCRHVIKGLPSMNPTPED